MAIITLLTDFGVQDEYAGVLKGVILGINPAATIVDITHGIAPQDVTGAAFTLQAAFHYFPRQTVHVAVVDPGVGTQRRIVAVCCVGHIFVAPDNGLLGPVLSAAEPDAVHVVENEKLFRHPVSRTFHGRDVFAPVAAHLSMGMPLMSVGPPVDTEQLTVLNISGPRMDRSGVLIGEVISVDRFGNLVTNISAGDLRPLGTAKIGIYIGKHFVHGLADTYDQGRKNEPLAIIGSRDCLEIAVNGGSAAKLLNVRKGQKVRVKAQKASQQSLCPDVEDIC